MAKSYCTGYFTGKVLWLLIDPRKSETFHLELFAIYSNHLNVAMLFQLQLLCSVLVRVQFNV